MFSAPSTSKWLAVATGLLSSRHGFAWQPDPPPRRSRVWDANAAGTLEEELTEETATREVDLESDYRWIDLTDLFSLALCAGWTNTVERHGFRMEAAGDRIVVDPCPLAGATTFRVPCREIPDRRYASDMDVAMELAAARWGECIVRVTSG